MKLQVVVDTTVGWTLLPDFPDWIDSSGGYKMSSNSASTNWSTLNLAKSS